ncbi:hypothetical protein EBR78_09155 [bacterium]|nr:hypothetical protein [bacterium]
MPNYLMILLVSLYASSYSLAGTHCETAFKQLQRALSPVSVNLKRAQELAEPFVNRKIASEVLTDRGVEAALQDSVSVKRDERAVAEAIEDALLARGMSEGQAKKAAKGWTEALKSQWLIQQ